METGYKDTVSLPVSYNQSVYSCHQGDNTIMESAMKKHPGNLLLATVLLAMLQLLPSLGLAMNNEEYDACILENQKNAKTNYAVHLIKEACTKLHKEGSFLFDDEEKYYQCILNNVGGVENDRALDSIRQVCRRQSQN